jgi:RNA polymerase sigma-70 factor (ECF subfamily)
MYAPAPDAAQWLPAARAGSKEALGRAFEACRAYLLLVAGRELDPELLAKGGASDLVQETFLEAQRDFGAFHGTTEQELLAWLRRLLLNNLANFRRRYRETAKRQAAAEVPLDAAGSSAEWADALAAGTPLPGDELIAQEQAAAVRQALARLPEEYRAVLVLRCQEDRSFEDIGRQMNRSANAAQKLWARALHRLQQELEAPP